MEQTERRTVEEVAEGEMGCPFSMAVVALEFQAAAERFAENFEYDDDPTIKRAVELARAVEQMELRI